MIDPHKTTDHTDEEFGHEEDTVNVTAVVRVGMILTAIVVLGMVIVGGIMSAMGTAQRDAEVPQPDISLPVESTAPELNPHQSATLKQQLAREKAWLDSYGWIDRQAGIVHIPIERSMDLIARNGLPSWPAPSESKSKESQ